MDTADGCLKTADGCLKTSDGLKLFTRQWERSSPRALCFVVHGVGEHGGRYDALAKELNRRGFLVQAMDHRGHGRSEGRRGDCRSIRDFVDDLRRWIQEAEERFPHLPRFMVGHSLGGLIGLTYAVDYPQTLRGVAVSSPSLRLAQEPPRVKRLLAETLVRILPRTPIPNGVKPHLLCRDSQVVEKYRKDPLVHRVLTARCAIALRQAMKESFSLAGKLKIPILILQGGDDRICDPQAPVEFAMAANQAPVVLRRYDGLYHELFNEPERGQVIQDLTDWMEGVLKR